MTESTFNAGISGRNVVAAPAASQSGTNNVYVVHYNGPLRPRKLFSTIAKREWRASSTESWVIF
ncbi:hypothetical protein CH63R_12620 [Colletotrichum higginsianum IMI 349063]|uniref:Uncharacterized protein n=1 Tax=Colletotrichum higginsianum (strain IMI 349063) TaxID=759273 RepID=A0A1B7XUS1_COLHI|nr:hypothetical protein CH63R_12620 [Colletotrichum higginsianum IMI 349063]OBR03493.1 hypothetical protein CH63R_12620 [Colletotrichum higginsianum IMI 349063]